MAPEDVAFCRRLILAHLHLAQEAHEVLASNWLWRVLQALQAGLQSMQLSHGPLCLTRAVLPLPCVHRLHSARQFIYIYL